jgi:hypothetical protein
MVDIVRIFMDDNVIIIAFRKSIYQITAILLFVRNGQ